MAAQSSNRRLTGKLTHGDPEGVKHIEAIGQLVAPIEVVDGVRALRRLLANATFRDHFAAALSPEHASALKLFEATAALRALAASPHEQERALKRAAVLFKVIVAPSVDRRLGGGGGE